MSINYCDYHVHSSFSTDGISSVGEQLEKASELGIGELCFTEHYEVDLLNNKVWKVDLNKYINDIKKFNQSSKVRLKCGLEIGLPDRSPGTLSQLIDEIKDWEFDYIIASLHTIEETTPFNSEYFEGRDINRAASWYLETLYQRIQNLDPKYYSSVGHIDYVSKGAHGLVDPRINYHDISDQLDSLFKYIIPLGKCIEINTSTYRNLGSLEIPGYDWLSRYAELGGEFITLGSDAHVTKHLGYRIKDAAELAKSAGIKYYATYEKMKPTLHKL